MSEEGVDLVIGGQRTARLALREVAVLGGKIVAIGPRARIQKVVAVSFFSSPTISEFRSLEWSSTAWSR